MDPRFDDAFGEIDRMIADDAKPPAGTKPPKPASEAPPKSQDAPEEPPKPSDTPAPKSSPKELRAAYDEAKARIKALETELTTVRSAKPPEDPEKKTLAERLEAAEKRRAEIEDALRMTAYERSDEFKQRYVEPWKQAVQSAYDDIAQLSVTDAEGNAVKATPDHFNALLRMSMSQAVTQAKEWFGDAAPEVLAMRRHVIELDQASRHAIEVHRKEASERERQMQEQSTRTAEEVRGWWRQYVDEGLNGHPELFQAGDDDPKGKELLTKGFALADRGFSPPSDMPRREVVRLHAAIRNKAGGFDFMVYKARKLAARVKELEAQVAEFEQSQPGEGAGRKPKPEGAASWQDEIEALAREGA